MPTKKTMFMRSAALTGMMAVAAAAGAPAFAQTPAAGAGGGSDQNVDASASSLSEIIVTARKKSETLLDVPLAISALPAAEIEKRGISSLSGVAATTPSLTVTSYGNGVSNRAFQTVIIRGVVPGALTSNTTTVFVNGAPLGASGLIDGLGDVAQIEIVKGPQSAYFGRSTFGGAINLITKKPADEFRATIDGLYGSHNWVDVKGSIEGPIIRDVLNARLSARYYDTEGYFKNPNQPEYPFGAQNSKNLFAELLFTPINGLEVRAFGAYIKQEDGQQALQKFIFSDFNCQLPGGRFVCGVAPALPLSRVGPNVSIPPSFIQNLKNTPARYKDMGLTHSGTMVENKIGTLSVTYDIPSSGGLTVAAVTSANQVYANSIADLYNEYFPDTHPRYPFDTFDYAYAFSQELRLTSDQDQSLRWAVGGNYYYTNTGQMNAGLNPVAGFQTFGSSGVNRNRTVGVFGSLVWDVNSKLTLNLEGRYQTDTTIGYTRTGVNGVLVESKVPGLRISEKQFLPRVIAQYKFLPNQQVYATYSKGMSPGLFNAGVVAYNAATQAYVAQITGASMSARPEEMQNYEIGYKGALFDGRVQVDVNAYKARWTNQLISQTVAIQNAALTGTAANIIIGSFSNNGDTDLQGVEGNVYWKVNDSLSLSVGGSVNDSNINKYSDVGAALLLAAPTPPPLDIFAGKQLPFYSKYSAAMSADYVRPIREDLDGFVHLDYSYKSGVFESPGNFSRSRDRHVANLRLGLEQEKRKYEFFVENLFNDLNYSSYSGQRDLFRGNQRLVLGALPPPRRVGVRLHAEF